MQKKIIISLLGPTASGKTDLALRLVEQLPLEIISVDSAMIYRGMNIGTAKPSADILAKAPHHLIDIRDPADIYSAADFVADAKREIDAIFAGGKIPLLVGGTMMYVHALQNGLADLPTADATIRKQIEMQAAEQGWPALHQQLADIDPVAGSRINQNDPQRIQRALEVYYLTGQTITQLQQAATTRPLTYPFLDIALFPQDRIILHQRIEQRFMQMLEQGLIAEVEQLLQRGDLHADLPSMRTVGYRQVWQYLHGELTYQEMIEKAIIATRQLAKRQLTWLRSWLDLHKYDSVAGDVLPQILKLLIREIKDIRGILSGANTKDIRDRNDRI